MSRQIVEPADAEYDHIDTRRAQWRREIPDLDTTGMAILGRLRWITLQARKPIEAVFARHNLDAGEFDVLSTLLRSGAPYRLRPTELYTQLMISSGGLTDRLARLERARLVRRIPSESDARSLLVELTELGQQLAERAFREDMAVEALLLAGMTDAECEQLASLLIKLDRSVMNYIEGRD